MTPAVEIVQVDVPDSPYSVVVGPGVLQSAGERLAEHFKSRRIAVVTDSHVDPLHGPTLRKSLENAGFKVIWAVIPAGEEHKNISEIARVYDALLGAGIERSTPVIALGGGMIGDMAGFTAATLLRGVPFAQIPTSLLAMVDASVGGKTGVNHAVGKNLIGAFYQPRIVLADPQVLLTLPAGEFHGGLAECIKHDIIVDAAGFARLEERLDLILKKDLTALTQLVAHNVGIKASIVAADPFEQGHRAWLNFGHTFAHAIETVSHYQYSHGQAVALGMAAASEASLQLGMIDRSTKLRILRLIERANLPVSGLKLNTDELTAAMLFDKKVRQGKIRFILPTQIGKVIIRDDVPEQIVRAAIESLRGN